MSSQISAGSARSTREGPSVLQQATGVFGVVAILSGLALLNPEWGQWTAWARWPLVGSLVLLVLGTVLRIRRRGGRRSDRMAGGLKPLMGQNWNPDEGMRASRFTKGRPQKVVINYPDSIVDTDPEWRSRVESMVKARMNAPAIDSKWNTQKGRVVFQAKTKWTGAERAELDRKAAETRVHDILRPMFGTRIEVSVTDWQQTEGEQK